MIWLNSDAVTVPYKKEGVSKVVDTPPLMSISRQKKENEILLPSAVTYVPFPDRRIQSFLLHIGPPSVCSSSYRPKQ